MFSPEIPADTQLALYTMFGNMQKLLESVGEEENYKTKLDTLPQEYKDKYHELHQVSPTCQTYATHWLLLLSSIMK